MTGYQLNGQSAVNVTNSVWVKTKDGSCSENCMETCTRTFMYDDRVEEDYENALFGSYADSATPCNPNTYNVTWYDGNTTMTTNQCTYNSEFVVPTVQEKIGYIFKGFEVVQ